MRLALAMGYPSVRRLQSHTTSAEFVEWMAFYTLEPFGPLAEDHRAGVIASAVAGGVPKGTPKDKVPGPAAFFPTLDPAKRREKKQTPADMMGILRSLAGRGIGTYTEAT